MNAETQTPIEEVKEIPEEAQNRIEEEKDSLNLTLNKLANSETTTRQSLRRNSEMARDLTSQIVASRRDSEKQMLANDEAVSHALSSKNKSSLDDMKKIKTRPYFARIVLEDRSFAKPREIEYKIGKVACPDANIIDWKNAPLAKLYYEYKEGEEYLEDIRDVERVGTLKRRHSVKIKDSELEELQYSDSIYRLNKEGKWESASRVKRSDGHSFELPTILSLITKDQFRLITDESDSPVILVGIAGSGKTIVALHRLSWQLENNTGHSAVVVTPTNLLKTYVENSLKDLSSENIKARTIEELVIEVYKARNLKLDTNILSRSSHPRLSFIKHSKPFIEMFLDAPLNSPNETFASLALKVLTNIISEEGQDFQKNLYKEAFQLMSTRYTKGEFESEDLLLELLFDIKKHGKIQSRPELLYIDEYQDFSALELCLLGFFVKTKGGLTVTGDPSQKTSDDEADPVLDFLFLSDGDENRFSQSSVISMTIAHRSTVQIMKFADHISGENRTERGRNGKAPLLILSDNPTDGFRELKEWLKRVGRNYPTDAVLVLTHNKEEAKQVYSGLKTNFDLGVHLLTEAPRNLQGLILVASIDQCKGLEFPHVGLWKVTRETFPLAKRARNLLYLGATRAEEHLSVFVCGEPSPLLPDYSSKMVRIYDQRKS